MHRSLVVAAALLAACAGPQLAMPANTPADVAALTQQVFDDFVRAFPARAACIGRVQVHGAWELDERAIYQPADRSIHLRIPATAPQLTTSLVHELGHHLEHSCPEQADVRSAFLASLGLPTDTPWPGVSDYRSDPSELWAESVVRYVTGRPDHRRPLRVTDAAVEVVAGWAAGRAAGG